MPVLLLTFGYHWSIEMDITLEAEFCSRTKIEESQFLKWTPLKKVRQTLWFFVIYLYNIFIPKSQCFNNKYISILTYSLHRRKSLFLETQEPKIYRKKIFWNRFWRNQLLFFNRMFYVAWRRILLGSGRFLHAAWHFSYVTEIFVRFSILPNNFVWFFIL